MKKLLVVGIIILLLGLSISSTAIADGRVYVGSYDNKLYCFDEATPDLDCEGNLVWTEVEPGSLINSTVSIENIGEPGSLLDWEIVDWPEDFGTWTFNPSVGLDLTPEDGVVVVNISVVAPDKKNKEFLGNITITNKNDENDSCIIPVSISTPMVKTIYFRITIFEWFCNHLLHNFPILNLLSK